MRVTLKLATSLDGRIATASGESRWITGEKAREEVHRLRAAHSAVLVGVETVIADDPELTVRLPGFMDLQPARVVLDSKLRIPSTCKLVSDARRVRTVIVSLKNSNKCLTDAGATVLKVAQAEGRPDLREALQALQTYLSTHTDPATSLFAAAASKTGVARRRDYQGPGGDYSILVEGGGQVAASFLQRGLVDAIEWFRAPIVLGDEGRPAVGEFVLQRLADAPRFRRVAVTELGDDLWERYERTA